MKVVIPLLILMSLLITEAVAQNNIPPGPPTGLKATGVGDRQVTLSWTPPSDTGSHPISSYERRAALQRPDGSISQGDWGVAGGQPTPITSITLAFNRNGKYTFRIRAVSNAGKGTPSDPITVIITIPAPTDFTATLDAPTTGDRTVTLTWTAPTVGPSITHYEYSQNGGTWTSTGSTSTTHSVTGLQNGISYTFRVRAVRSNERYMPNGLASRTVTVTPLINAPGTPRTLNVQRVVLSFPNRRIIQECPVGWQRTDRFAQPNPRVLIHEVKLEVDLQNRVSIYKPNYVVIYVHPDEGLETLDGWKLKVAVPYNHHRDYLLTAENSVVVDANIEGVEGGFAFIENPEEAPFPMVGMGFTGAHVPGFDYRLYDDTGRKVDFGIACYKSVGIFQALKDMEDPRVLRNVLLETLDWDSAPYIRSEWTVPVPVNVPGAPSLQGVNLVGKWAALKKQ